MWVGVAGAALGASGSGAPVVVFAAVLVAATLVLRNPGAAGFAAVLALSYLAVQWSHGQPRGVLPALAASVPHCILLASVAEQAGGLGTLVSVDVAHCDEHLEVRDAGVVILDSLDLDIGTTLRAEGWLMPFSDEEWDRARARTRAQAAFVASDVEPLAPPRGILGVASSVRRSLVTTTRDLDVRNAALIRGLTIGDTSDMDEGTEHAFRRTGLSHLVAVSGSNVAIVLAVVAGVVKGLPLVSRSALCLAALAFYVVVVGPEPSVLRAAAMGTVMLAGLLWGRPSEPLQALGVALVVLLVLRPEMVASVGLHLSAGATAGIVLWGRPLALLLARRIPPPVAYALGATLAAQVAVAPFLALVFGEISVIAPLANLLAVGVVAPATILGLTAALVGLVSPAAGSLPAKLAEPCAGWIVGVAENLGRLSWAAVEIPRPLGWALAGCVALAAVVTLVRPPGPPGRSTRVR